MARQVDVIRRRDKTVGLNVIFERLLYSVLCA